MTTGLEAVEAAALALTSRGGWRLRVGWRPGVVAIGFASTGWIEVSPASAERYADQMEAVVTNATDVAVVKALRQAADFARRGRRHEHAQVGGGLAAAAAGGADQN